MKQNNNIIKFYMNIILMNEMNQKKLRIINNIKGKKLFEKLKISKSKNNIK